MPATPACDPPAPAQPLRHSRSGPPALFRGAFLKKKKFAADFLSEALFLSRFSSFTEPVTCKSIGVRARVHEEKRGSCVLCECGGGFLKKEEEWGGGGEIQARGLQDRSRSAGLGHGQPEMRPRGRTCGRWSPRRLPAPPGLLGLSFHRGAGIRRSPSASNLTFNKPQSVQKPESFLRGSICRRLQRGHL